MTKFEQNIFARSSRGMQRSVAFWLGCTFVLLSLASFCQAQEGHVVDAIYPQGGQVGTSVDVTIRGSFLDNLKEVLFYDEGIRCTGFGVATKIYDDRGSVPRDPQPGVDMRMTLEIAKDCRVGEHQLRILTEDNLSEVMTFWVSRFPIVDEAHPLVDDPKDPTKRNDKPEFAQAIPRNCTVSGYKPHYKTQDHDWYSVMAEKGQRLSVEIVAARLGTWNYGGMNDPAVSIHDINGKELARNDDNSLHTQDPVVSIIIPADGKYLIHIRQQMDYENRLCHYLMHVGTFARPMTVFPLGGQAGKKLPVELLGPTLDKVTTELKLPKPPGQFESAYHSFYYLAKGAVSPVSPPWPNRVHVATFPDVFEQAEASSLDQPQLVIGDLPVALNGKIQSEGETDWYKFQAKKGERYRVRTYGKTLASDLDAKVWIRPAQGNESKRSYEEDDSLWDQHDLVGHHYRWQIKDRMDPIFMFEPDRDGEWLIGIGDTQRKFGPRHIYRVEFQRHVDSAFVQFPAYPNRPLIMRDRIVLFPGHSYSRPFGIQKGFGSNYKKALRVRALNLPDGVTMSAPEFKQSDQLIPIQFTADTSAQFGAQTVDVVVEPVDENDRENFRGGFVHVSQATNRRGDYAMCFNKTRKMALAVVKGANFDLKIQTPEVPLVQNGELELAVMLKRHGDFTGAVYCEADWLPQGVTKQPPLIIPAGQSSGTYKIAAKGNATIGDFPISICGRENEIGNPLTGAGFHYVSSPFIKLQISAPYVKVSLARTAIERGTTGRIVAEIDHLRPFNGEAKLKLGRLPYGTEQLRPYPTIKSGQKNAVAEIAVTADCLIGQYKDISCEVIVTEGSQEIRQRSGSGVLRVDAERK